MNESILRHQGRSQGEEGNSSALKPKVIVVETGVISEGSILVTNYPKLIKIQFFCRIFIMKSQNLPTIRVFRPNAREIHAWFVKVFEIYAKIMQFLNFLKNVFGNFLKFSGVQIPPPQGRSQKVFPKKSWPGPCKACIELRNGIILKRRKEAQSKQKMSSVTGIWQSLFWGIFLGINVHKRRAYKGGASA